LQEEITRQFEELPEAPLSNAPASSSAVGCLAPNLLRDDLRNRIEVAKKVHAARIEIESNIPSHLLSIKGAPTTIPTFAEAELLAGIRREVSTLLIMHAAPSSEATCIFSL
jgi:hypothetical protein